MLCGPKLFNTGRYVQSVGQFGNKNDKIFIILCKNLYRTSMILQSQYLITHSSKKPSNKRASYENNTVYNTFEGKAFTLREENGYSWENLQGNMLTYGYC